MNNHQQTKIRVENEHRFLNSKMPFSVDRIADYIGKNYKTIFFCLGIICIAFSTVTIKSSIDFGGTGRNSLFSYDAAKSSMSMNKSLPNESPQRLEHWLARKFAQEHCDLLPRSIPPEHWYSKVIPDSKPDFTLLSAWLKPEYPSAQSGPKEIPEMYEDMFTMGGKIPVTLNYFDQVYLGKTAETSAWTEELIQNLIEKAKRKQTMKYGKDGLTLHGGFEKFNSFVNNTRGIVIGSEDPWVEAIALSHGARKILTVEFGSIESSHPQVDTMIPSKFTERFLNGEIEPFDFAVSFSSLEHDGLGRYGDVLNPIGDLQSMAKMLSVIKPGGLFFLAVPSQENDELSFNGARAYGKLRLPKLFAGFELVDAFQGFKRPGSQPLYVLQNLNGCFSGQK